jgi:hypothetical protein
VEWEWALEIFVVDEVNDHRVGDVFSANLIEFLVAEDQVSALFTVHEDADVSVSALN